MIRKTTILTLLFLAHRVLALAQTASFTASNTSGCSPLVVSFQDQSSGNPTSWFWDFGNGATSTLQNPSTTYFTPGTYTVTLTATNGAGSNTLTRTGYITVYGKPSVYFTVNDSVACFPHRAQFTDLSTASTGTSNATWLWDFGDGTQSTQQNPLHIYTTTGNYTVTLKVTNDKGCYSVFTKQAYIKISGGVQTSFTNSQPNVCRPPFVISFTNTSTGPGTLTWYWDFGDGNTSTQQNPTHTYTAPGNYVITAATTSSGGCTDTLVRSNVLNIQNIQTQFTAPDSICVNDPVPFLNTSTPTPVASNWQFGDATASFLPNPPKTYTTVGTYTVKLYNTYSYCIDSFTKDIRILPRPVADFQAPVRTKCQPQLTVDFQDLSTNAVGWHWDFGDGNTSTQQNPSHNYTAYGTFDVTLIVTNSSGCTDTMRKPAYVIVKRPFVQIDPLPVNGCLPYTLSPTPNVTTLDAVTSYSWDFGDGYQTTGPNPTHTYTTQGAYTVSLTITTSTGCTETHTVSPGVTVGRRPIIDFSATPNPVCALQPVQFTDLTNEGDHWVWHFGDGGTSSNQNPLHQYGDTGLFNVQLIVTNNGCTDSLTKDDFIHVKPPIAKFGFVTDCSNRLLFNFKDSSIGATSWFWDFGDGTNSTAQNPVHVFPGYSTYTVTLTVSNDTCSNSYTKIIRVVNETPDFTGDPLVICRHNIVSFQVTNVNPANIVYYYWDFGNGIVVPNNTIPLTAARYDNSGYYSVTLITTDIYGCRDTVPKLNYVRVNGPQAGFSADVRTGCKGLNVHFNDLSQTDGLHNIVSWKWDFGDGTVQTFTSAPFQHIYVNAGTYDVKLVVTDATGCVDSLTQTAYIITSDPKADFVSADTLACPGSTVHFTNLSNAVNYTSYWDFGDGNTSTVNAPADIYQATGIYTVKLRIVDQYGCADSITKPDYIKVNKPVASFTVNDSISSCTPFEVDFTNTSQYYNSSTWNLGGGMSTLTNPVQFYNTPGVYNIQLVVTSPGGCTDTARSTVQVYDTVGSRVTYTPLDGCKPLLVDLNAFSPGPMSYTWDFGDGVLINSHDTTSIQHIYDFFGNFVPKVILTDPSGCIIPVSGIDTIHIKGATVKFGIDNRLFCDSGLVHFTDSTTFNDSLSVYNWDFGDGGISHIQNPSHYYSSPGQYNVLLNVQTQNACVDTFRLSFPIKVVTSPLISITGDSVVCVNGFMQHDGVFDRSDTSAVQWSWKFPNGNTSGQQTPVIQQYTSAGNFVVTTIATNSSGCRDTAVKNIRVNPLPTVTMPSTITMQAGYPVQIPAVYTPNVMSWVWTPPATLSCADCPQPTASPKFNTKYNVSFIDSNGCQNVGEVQVIVICKDANVFVPNTFSPNGDGTNDQFYIRGRGLDRVKSLRIFNRWGEVVFEQQNFPVNNPMYGWDGTYKGHKPVPDVYVYQVEVFCDNSQIIHFEGNVALIQ